MRTTININTVRTLTTVAAISAAIWFGYPGYEKLTSASEAPPNAAPVAPTVGVSHAVQRELAEWDEYTGRVAAVQSVDVRSRVTGYLKSLHFTEGETVEAGQLLMVIDPRPAKAHLAAAKAAQLRAESELQRSEATHESALARKTSAESRARLAEVNYARSKKLFLSKAVSHEEHDTRRCERNRAESGVRTATAAIREAQATIASAKAAIEVAKAEVTDAELQVEFTRVTAPFAGRVSDHFLDIGNLVRADDTVLTTINSLGPVHVVFEASESDYLKYLRLDLDGRRETSRKAAHPVTLRLGDENSFAHSGQMDFIDNQLDGATGTIRGRAIVPNPDGVLLPGLFARVRLQAETPSTKLLVPEEAISTDQNASFVLVVGDDNVIQRRAVELGTSADGLQVVRDGINTQDRIVIDGFHYARPGMTITPEEITTMPSAAEIASTFASH